MSCDVIVKGVVGDERKGWSFDVSSDHFVSDLASEVPISDEDLRALSQQPGQALTYTCAPPGAGWRMGIDRDGDGSPNRDEIAAFTDPRVAGSLPGACDDGIDNDDDGAIDFPEDADCLSSEGDSELPAPEIGIDVNPRRERPIRLGSRKPIPVVVLGSMEFDIDLIDPDETAFGPNGVAPIGQLGRWRSSWDWNRDGFRDLLAFYDADESGLKPGATEACLEGEVAGSPFRACDRVRVLPEPPACAVTDLRSWWRCFVQRRVAHNPR